MGSVSLFFTVVVFLHVYATQACYQECSAAFNRKISQLVGITDRAVLTQRSCEAMSEQMTCLKTQQTTCQDPRSLQVIDNILSFIRPDYQLCARTLSTNTTTASDGTSTTSTDPNQQLMLTCGQKGRECHAAFNRTFYPALAQPINMTALCKSLDEYTVCAEQLIPECGQFLGTAINTIRAMQQQYSNMCSGTGANPETVTDCVNRTMDCYTAFNTTFLPAMNQYILSDMCSSIDNYSACLQAVHAKTECQRYTTQALAGILTLKRQYSMHCGSDSGQLTQRCMSEFQNCYVTFNNTYFPSVRIANMDAMCSAVNQYTDCVQRLFPDCSQQLGQALQSVRAMKEQHSLTCDKQFQKLVKCQPLTVCSQDFARTFAMGRSTAAFCTSLKNYFPCVERSMADCNIASSDNKIDFSDLGNLTGDFCQNFLNHPMLMQCEDFTTCSKGVMVASGPQGTSMFDGGAWCSYMDMSLICADRALLSSSCGLTNDIDLRNQLTRLEQLKMNICEKPVTPPANIKVSGGGAPPGDSHTGDHAGQEGRGSAVSHLPAFTSLVLLLVMSLVFQRTV